MTNPDHKSQKYIYLLNELLPLSFIEIGDIQIKWRLPVNTWIKLDWLRVILAVHDYLPLQFVCVVNILSKNPWTNRNIDMCVPPWSLKLIFILLF